MVKYNNKIKELSDEQVKIIINALENQEKILRFLNEKHCQNKYDNKLKIKFEEESKNSSEAVKEIVAADEIKALIVKIKLNMLETVSDISEFENKKYRSANFNIVIEGD